METAQCTRTSSATSCYVIESRCSALPKSSKSRPKVQTVVLQDQQHVLDRYSDTLKRDSPGLGAAEDGAEAMAGKGQDEARLCDGAERSSLNRHSSHLTWSQRQQLRRTSAAVRRAAASRHAPPQESRGPPGSTPPLPLLRLSFCAVQSLTRQPPRAFCGATCCAMMTALRFRALWVCHRAQGVVGLVGIGCGACAQEECSIQLTVKASLSSLSVPQLCKGLQHRHTCQFPSAN